MEDENRFKCPQHETHWETCVGCLQFQRYELSRALAELVSEARYHTRDDQGGTDQALKAALEDARAVLRKQSGVVV
jgi:hypothetical protein